MRDKVTIAWARAGEILGAPDFLAPWLDRFLEEQEVGFVLAVAEAASANAGVVTEAGPSSAVLPRERAEEIAARYFAEAPPTALARLGRRGLLDGGCGESAGRVRLADFHARFEVWALFEGWKDLPDDVRARLNEWELQAYERRKLPQIDALRRGEEPDPALENSEYLLLHEAESVIDRVEHVYLWPCNCRAMMGHCDKPVLTCLRFENNRGLGWEISKERAKEVLRAASRAGLMHTGELARDGERVTGAICNCCGDCCYPHLIAERHGAARIWPHSRYVARHLPERCSGCGRCVRRCPFGAFVFADGDAEEVAGRAAAPLEAPTGRVGRRKSPPLLDVRKCRGCGVCWVACPEEAIVMDLVEERGDA